MYQHSVEPKVLDKRLSEVVSSCVNEIGVDINSSSEHLLKFVAGLATNNARSITETLKRKRIHNRNELLEIKGFGPVTFRNCSGFLRVNDGDNPLDSTRVHPESYETVHKLLELTGFSRQYGNLTHAHLGSPELRQSFESVESWSVLAGYLQVDINTLLDTVNWLVSPEVYSSPHSLCLKGITSFNTKRLCDVGVAPTFKKIPPRSLSCSNPLNGGVIGSVHTGVVKNITTFGAFVELGLSLGRVSKSSTVMNTGLLHSSAVNLSTLIIGQSITVAIKSIDQLRGRVSLILDRSNFSQEERGNCGDTRKRDRATDEVEKSELVSDKKRKRSDTRSFI